MLNKDACPKTTLHSTQFCFHQFSSMNGLISPFCSQFPEPPLTFRPSDAFSSSTCGCMTHRVRCELNQNYTGGSETQTHPQLRTMRRSEQTDEAAKERCRSCELCQPNKVNIQITGIVHAGVCGAVCVLCVNRMVDLEIHFLSFCTQLQQISRVPITLLLLVPVSRADTVHSLAFTHTHTLKHLFLTSTLQHTSFPHLPERPIGATVSSTWLASG